MLLFLRRRLGSGEEAEEALQRFSLGALERASDLRDVRTVRGWPGQVLASTTVTISDAPLLEGAGERLAWSRST
jgi:phosphoserine phosphatase